MTCRLWRGGYFRWAIVSGGHAGIRPAESDLASAMIRASVDIGFGRTATTRERDLLAADHRCCGRAVEHPKRDLSRQ
jgi:hypothetical protein